MKTIIKRTRPVLLVATLLAAGSAAPADRLDVTPAGLEIIGVVFAPPRAAEAPAGASAPAEIVLPPASDRVVSTPQAGLVTMLAKATGERVQRDELIAQVRSTEALALQGGALRAHAALDLARANIERDRQLLEAGVIAGKRYQAANMAYREASAVYEEQRELLRIAGFTDADLERLLRTGRLTAEIAVRAPIDGVVTQQLVRVGDHLEALAPVYRVSLLTTLWAEARVSQERLGDVVVGERVVVGSNGMQGEVIQIGSEIDAANRTGLVRVKLGQGAQHLRPGQFVTVHFSGREGPLWSLPADALVRIDGRSSVFVREEQGLRLQTVEVVAQTPEDVLLRAAFDGRERIAVTGTAALKAHWLGMGSDE